MNIFYNSVAQSSSGSGITRGPNIIIIFLRFNSYLIFKIFDGKFPSMTKIEVEIFVIIVVIIKINI